MKHVLPLFLILALFVTAGRPAAAAAPDLAELLETSAKGAPAAASAASPACVRYNDLNTRIRDGRISKTAAQGELTRLLAEVGEEYYRRGGADHPATAWVFPLAGYDSRAMAGGRSKGFIARGYDFFSGNRHGGHPAYDIFIRDRNQDSLDDRSGRPVAVVSLGGGIVVALEREWEPGSPLRGGKYIWVYDPGNRLLVYYAHNSQLAVELGTIVKPGDLLGYVGRSGYNAAKRRSPTHLHFSVLKLVNGRPLPLAVHPELARARRVNDR